jgi:hypothetical protein
MRLLPEPAADDRRAHKFHRDAPGQDALIDTMISDVSVHIAG